MEARFSVSKKEEEKKVAMYVNISACKCFLVAQQASWLLLTKKKNKKTFSPREKKPSGTFIQSPFDCFKKKLLFVDVKFCS